MSNVWHNGGENATVIAGHEWDTLSGTNVTSTSNFVHGLGSLGQYAWRFLQSSAGISYCQHQFAAATNAGSWYYGFSLCVNAAPGALCQVFQLTASVAATVSVRLDTDRTLKMYRDDTSAQLGSTSAALTLDTVYWVSFLYDSTAGVGTVTARLNDVQFATGTAAANQNQYRVRWGIITSTTGECVIDDIFVNNSSGTVNNSYPTSDMYLIAGRPDAAGDFNECSSGSYASVAEVTADDVTTIAVMDADGDRLDVNIQDLATLYSLTSATDTIPFVAVWVRESAASTSPEAWNARVKSQGSGTLGSGPSVTHNDTTYKTNGDAAPLLPYVSQTDPQDGVAWAISDLVNAQIGVIATDAAPDVNLTQLWIYVCVKRVVATLVRDIIQMGIILYAR